MISCIIPTYNQCQYISETLDSIYSQDYQDFEIIVVDDGSTDNTLQIVGEYQKKYKKMIVISQHNSKLPTALNTGLKYAMGDYITWISSDSIYLPKAFSVMVHHLDKHKHIGMISTQFKIFGDREIEVHADAGLYNLERMSGGNFIGCCFMFRKACVDKVGYFDPDMICVEDWFYWCKIAQHFPILKIDGTYAAWRDHSTNMTNTIGKDLGFLNEAKLRIEVKKWKQTY